MPIGFYHVSACIGYFEVMPVKLLLTAVPILLFGTGLFYLLRLRGFYLLRPLLWIRKLFDQKGGDGISPFRALTEKMVEDTLFYRLPVIRPKALRRTVRIFGVSLTIFRQSRIS